MLYKFIKTIMLFEGKHIANIFTQYLLDCKIKIRHYSPYLLTEINVDENFYEAVNYILPPAT